MWNASSIPDTAQDSMTEASAIRPARPEDAIGLHRLLVGLAALDGGDGNAVTSTPEVLRRDGFGPDAKFHALVAEREGALVAFALYYWTYSSWRGAQRLHLEDIFIAESERGQGIGRRLLAALRQIATDRGAVAISLRVEADNNSARRFYAAMGFCESTTVSCRRSLQHHLVPKRDKPDS